MLLCILESELPYPCLTCRAFLPADLRTFVSADVDVFGREKFHHLCQDSLDEFKCAFLAHTKDIIGNAPTAPDFVWSSGTAVFRIGGKGGKHVARKVDFRDDGDSFGSGIAHYLANLILRVESSVSSIFVALPRIEMAYQGLVPISSHFGQLGIALYLDSPSLIVSEMPVQGVHLMHHHHIDVALDFSQVEEMTCRVEVKSAIREARLVTYLQGRKLPWAFSSAFRSIDPRRKKLAYGLQGIYSAVEA